MTPEAQRIALAELAGYKKVPCPSSSLGGLEPFDPLPLTYWQEDGWEEPIGLPDYLYDLNAIHELENLVLDDEDIMDASSKRYRYAGHLYCVVPNDKQPCRATAAQRAEALLRTLGRRKEDE